MCNISQEAPFFSFSSSSSTKKKESSFVSAVFVLLFFPSIFILFLGKDPQYPLTSTPRRRGGIWAEKPQKPTGIGCITHILPFTKFEQNRASGDQRAHHQWVRRLMHFPLLVLRAFFWASGMPPGQRSRLVCERNDKLHARLEPGSNQGFVFGFGQLFIGKMSVIWRKIKYASN